MPDPLDIKIVGGGLAGLVTALQIMERPRKDGRSYEITVYEKDKAAHTTLCGEGISDENLRRFTAFDSLPYCAETFEGAAWYMPNGKVFHVQQKCYTIERKDWIPAMAEAFQKRGGNYVTGKKLTVKDIPNLEYDILVGADGPGSVVQKYIGAKVDVKLGIQYRVRDSSYTTDRLEFYTDKNYCNEYAWIFPKGEILNVGLLADDPVNDWKRLDRFMRDKKVDGKIAIREGYPIAFNGTKVADPKHPGIALIGDAGGLTNPLTKGGICAVILASEILADCVARDELDHYDERIMTHPIMDPSFQRAVKWVSGAPNERINKLLRYLPDVILAGEGVPRSTHRWPILKTMLGNPGEIGTIKLLYHAMGQSRRYSW